MKKTNKIIVFVMSIILVNILGLFTYEVKAIDYGNMINQTQAFISTGKGQVSGISAGTIGQEFAPLGQILTTIGGGVMVAVATYMGIKYLTAGPEAQAKLKEQLIGVVVSGVVIFGAYEIWKLVLNIVSTFDH